ncbi:hypothetical protein [Streptomyces kebangsaanensis]|nr:hypothetical protein [Streptomyces kebangsaanensis]
MPEPGLLVLAGLFCWLAGCACWLAAGITHLVHTIRQTRARRQP